MAPLLPRRLVLAVVAAAFAGVGSERVWPAGDGNEDLGAARGTVVPGHWRSSARAAFVLALVASPIVGQAQQQKSSSKTFLRLDLDRNGLLSREEYQLISSQSPADAQSFQSLFFQADIDNDNQLSEEEFDFARYLGNERYIAEDYVHLEPHLPEGFKENFDQAFDELMRRKGAKVALKDVFVCVHRILGLSAGQKLTQQTVHSLQSLFEKADIIPDTVLNMNELDFFRFLAWDSMVLAALHREGLDPQKQEAAMEEFARDFVEEYDANEDGKLSEEEFILGLRDVFSDMADVFEPLMVERVEKFVQMTKDHFASADEDGDGLLSSKESGNLINHIMVSEDGES